MYVFVAIAVLAALASYFISSQSNESGLNDNTAGEIVCTMDAFECPDGTYVGRTGPNCEFFCPGAEVQVPLDVQIEIDSRADLVKVSSPAPNDVLASPHLVRGQARGSWFYEASFPVILVDWNGKIIAESIATAGGDWLTEDFVNFSTVLVFENPYNPDDPEFMKRGTLIFKKDNPSGLPEHDDALEIPIRFAP